MLGAVQRATLRLYVTDASSNGGSVYLVSNNYEGTTTAWIQSGLNWNNAPAISGTALSSAGAVSVQSWVEFDVTPVITGNGSFSFGLKSTTSDVVYYISKEGSNKPELVIQIISEASAAPRHTDPPLDEVTAPEKFALHHNYPNPFNPETRIDYDLPQSAFVRLSVYNVLGQEVLVLVEREHEAGSHTVIWDGRNAEGWQLGTGIYIYRLQTGAYSTSRKMLMVQ
jgi:hypothetical protein